MVSTVVGVIVLLTVFPGLDEEEGRWLHIKENSAISEVPVGGSLFTEPLDEPPLTTELTASIRAASYDDSVSGIFLDIRTVSMGWAQVQEVRAALDH